MNDSEWIAQRAALALRLMADVEVTARYISHAPEAYRLEHNTEAPYGLADRVMAALWDVEEAGCTPPRHSIHKR